MGTRLKMSYPSFEEASLALKEHVEGDDSHETYYIKADTKAEYIVSTVPDMGIWKYVWKFAWGYCTFKNAYHYRRFYSRDHLEFMEDYWMYDGWWQTRTPKSIKDNAKEARPRAK